MSGIRKKNIIRGIVNRTKRMNRDEALNRFNNIWSHGTTSLYELRVVVDRIKQKS